MLRSDSNANHVSGSFNISGLFQISLKSDRTAKHSGMNAKSSESPLLNSNESPAVTVRTDQGGKCGLPTHLSGCICCASVLEYGAIEVVLLADTIQVSRRPAENSEP